MPCARVRLADIGKYRKKYPHVRNLPKVKYVAQNPIEIQSMLIEIVDTDSVSFTFPEPFSGIPSVVANIVTVLPEGIVNVYVETASQTGATVRTSAVATGKIVIHAMYAASCAPVNYEAGISSQDLLELIAQNDQPIIVE